MLTRRSANGFNLAFLDVMACGLGAIILILMLVKFNAATETPNDELDRLQQELTALQESATDITVAINSVEKDVAIEVDNYQQSQQRLQQRVSQQKNTQQSLAAQQAVLANVEKALAAAAPRQADDNVQLQGAGEENYLLGLKVEGQYIGFLIDTSASMTDETLRDIIRRKISSDAEKKAAPKWQRTQRVTKWLLARVPQSSKISLVSFNDTASSVGSRSLISAKNSLAMQQLVEALEQLVPRNGTNLQTAIALVKKNNPKMTHLYVVTDGLPTLGNRSKNLRTLASCTSLLGQSKTITGECRLGLFAYTLQQANLGSVEVNVILLPLEGDPQAPQAYWDWTASTGGLTLSPAGSWP